MGPNTVKINVKICGMTWSAEFPVHLWVMRQAKRKHNDYQVIKGLAPLYSFVTDGKLQIRSAGQYVVAVC